MMRRRDFRVTCSFPSSLEPFVVLRDWLREAPDEVASVNTWEQNLAWDGKHVCLLHFCFSRLTDFFSSASEDDAEMAWNVVHSLFQAKLAAKCANCCYGRYQCSRSLLELVVHYSHSTFDCSGYHSCRLCSKLGDLTKELVSAYESDGNTLTQFLKLTDNPGVLSALIHAGACEISAYGRVGLLTLVWNDRRSLESLLPHVRSGRVAFSTNEAGMKHRSWSLVSRMCAEVLDIRQRVLLAHQECCQEFCALCHSLLPSLSLDVISHILLPYWQKPC